MYPLAAEQFHTSLCAVRCDASRAQGGGGFFNHVVKPGGKNRARRKMRWGKRERERREKTLPFDVSRMYVEGRNNLICQLIHTHAERCFIYTRTYVRSLSTSSCGEMTPSNAHFSYSFVHLITCRNHRAIERL